MAATTKIGAHVGMSGKEMFIGSVKEAVSYGADTFMVYTGAPQNTRRKEIQELRIPEGLELAEKEGINEFIIHAPYIINLGNPVKKETWELAVRFLTVELERTAAMHGSCLVLHPGSHVGEGVEAGLAKIIEGLNEVLSENNVPFVALETMAGKGSEMGKSFEELSRIYDGVKYPDKLRVCFDTCHVHDAGYDIIHHFDEVMEEFDRLIGKEQIAVFHINDSKNDCGSHKDRHENIGFGKIGFEALHRIVFHPDFLSVPKILETPYVPDEASGEKYAPYKLEIQMLREGRFWPDFKEQVINSYKSFG